MFRRLLLALVLGLVLPATVWSAFDKGGVLGVGARPMGLGGAFVAIADDSTAIHWNPAGLIQLPRMEGSLFFAPLLNGKEYYMSGAFAMPFLEQTALGISVVSLFHDTGNADTQAFENIYIASVATPLNVEKTVSFGVNIKFLQFDSAAHATYTPAGGQAQTIEAKASALGMDLGGLYQILLASHGKKINVGFLAQDLDTVLNWQSGVTERVPLYLQTGLAYYPNENISISVDYSFFNDQNISGQALSSPVYTQPNATGQQINTLQPQQHRPHVGMEGWFFDGRLGLRAGYSGFATIADRFTGGVSYKQDWFGVDYAYMGHAEHLGDSHRLGGHIAFGGSGERPRVVALVNPPTGLGVRPNNNSVQLTWEANPDPHVTGYTVYMSKASGANYAPVQRRIRENKIIIDGLTNGSRYYFVITSVNNSWPAVESAYSTEVSSVPAPQVPSVPGMGGTQTPAASGSGTAYVLARGWPVPAGSVMGYNLYLSDTSGTGYKKVNNVAIKDPSYVVRGLDPDKRYFFVITSLSSDTPPVESRPSTEQSLISHPESELPQTAPVPGGQ